MAWLDNAQMKRGAIDPCFPSKLGIPHIHNLLYKVHAKKALDLIFFPMIDCLTTGLYQLQASRSCPTAAATPEAVKAAFTKEGDLFKEKGGSVPGYFRQPLQGRPL